MRLKNKTAIITGGGTGVGLSCARLFCREGAKVVIFGRRKAKLEDAIREIGENAHAVRGDLTNEKDLQTLVSTALDRLGRIDILVNNAGMFDTSPFEEMDDAHWDDMLDVNLRSVYKLTQKVIPHMLEHKSGSLIHISSILGLISAPGTTAYSVSKGALTHFSRTLAIEYGPRGIRSNTICPGMIETDMTADIRKDKTREKELLKSYPLRRFGTPEDVARACLFLASDESSFVTGTVLPVDGGKTLR